MPETKNNNKNPCLLEGHLNRNFKTDFQFEALCVRVCVCVCVCVFLSDSLRPHGL